MATVLISHDGMVRGEIKEFLDVSTGVSSWFAEVLNERNPHRTTLTGRRFATKELAEKFVYKKMETKKSKG